MVQRITGERAAAARKAQLAASLEASGVTVLYAGSPGSPAAGARVARWMSSYRLVMSDQSFVPVDFAVPGGLTAEHFRLEPLGPRYNVADYAAWTASIGHIQATPGFDGTGWPHQMSLADNLRDLERHAQDFAERRWFTYTVLSAGTGEVIGCAWYQAVACLRALVEMSGWTHGGSKALMPVIPGWHRARLLLSV